VNLDRDRRRLLAAALLGASGWVPATSADESAWRVLAGRGWAVMLRHAQTVPGVGDPPGFRLDDCSTQRNLSEVGRAWSRRFGEEFVRRDIRPDEVLASRWCRCIDTARLAFPGSEVRVFEPLNSFFADGSRREQQNARLREHLATQDPGRRIVMVTHQVNITALTGEFVAMGEAMVVRLGPVGAGTPLARLRLG
jgi:broad specificity phosphatase PhoE